jgi:hypothetical protein
VKIQTSSAGTDNFAFRWAGDHYVFVFSDPTVGNGDIYTLNVDSSGKPMGQPVAVEATPAASILPNVVATQSGYLVVWEEGTAGQAVYVHATDMSGNPIGQGLTVASTAAPQARPVISAAPGGFALAWMDVIAGIPAVQVALLDGSMKLTGPQRVGTNASYPWLAGDQDSVGLIWSDKSTTQYNVTFADVDPMTLALSNETPLRTNAPRDSLLGRVGKTSFGYLAAWEDYRADDNQIFMSMVDDNGMHIADGLVEEPNSGDANWPNIAWNGTDAGIVYYQWRDSNPQIFISFVDGMGKRVANLNDLQVSNTTASAKYPDVVWTGSEFGVAWIDTRGGAAQLYLARVACHT